MKKQSGGLVESILRVLLVQEPAAKDPAQYVVPQSEGVSACRPFFSAPAAPAALLPEGTLEELFRVFSSDAFGALLCWALILLLLLGSAFRELFEDERTLR